MKFAITGATGFVGKKVVSELLRTQHSVRVLGRSAEKVASLFGNAVEFQAWDPMLPAAPKEALQGIDAVIHLAGEGIADKRWSERQKERIYQSRISGTRNIVATLKLAGENGPKTFVSASAIGFYGDRQEEVLTETSSSGTGYLPHVCADWEKEASLAPSSIRTVAVRIGIVLGKEGGRPEKASSDFSTGSGRARRKWSPMDELDSRR